MESVSIVIPVYNVEKYLTKCIDSILNQNHANIEILLINDGSTDSSGSLCDKYAKNDGRIKVFHQHNQGVSVARNIGIENASGDWICFVDADDWLEYGALEKMFDIPIDNKPDIIIGRSYTNRNGKVEENDERYSFDKDWIGKYYSGIKLRIDKGYGRGSVCGAIFYRNFLLSHNIVFPINLKIGEDSIFFSLCSIYAERISFADVHLYNVYEREGSASRCWSFERVLIMVDNIWFLNNYIDSHPQLSIQGINILNYAKYGVISNIFNNFHYSFSLKNYFILRKKISRELKGPIETGQIKSCRNKVRILNISLDFFAVLVLIKNCISQKMNII